MNPPARPWLPWILGAGLFLLFLRPDGSNDFGFHLRIGEEILATGCVPTEDHHSTTADGAEYIDQEWLSQVLFALIHRSVGVDGILILCAAAAAGTFVLLWRLMEGPDALRLLLLLLAAPLADSHFHARPHVLAWAFLPLLLLLLRSAPAWAPLACLALWANLHASFVLGVFLATLHFAERGQWARVALSAAAPLLNPYGWRLYGFLLGLRDLPLDDLGEFRPFPTHTFPFACLALFAALLAAGIVLRFWQDERIQAADFWNLGRALVLGALGFRAVRFAPVMAFCLSPLVSALWAPACPRIPRWLGNWLAGGALAASLILLGSRVRSGASGHLGMDEIALPLRSTEFLLRLPLEGEVFNDYNFGGTLLWKAWPKIKVFVDGRIDVYRGAPYEDYRRISGAAPDWKEIAATRDVRCFFVRPERPVARALLQDPGWGLVYFDYNTVIFLPEGDHPGVRRLRLITPYGHRDRSRIPELISECEYLLRQNERFFGGHKILAELYWRDGRIPEARREMARYLELRPEGLALQDTREILAKLGMK